MKIKLIAIALLISVSSFAQVKAPEKKPAYKKFVQMELSDVQTYIQALNKWKSLAPYDQSVSDADKVKVIRDIDSFLTDLLKRIKIDSTLVVDSVKLKRK